MSKLLSELLGAKEPYFSLDIKRLEQSSGYGALDNRLSAEIVGKVHLQHRAMGLDPKDTTGRELYRSLLNLASKHDKFLLKAIGFNDSSDVDDLLSRIISCSLKMSPHSSSWSIKPKVLKLLLKENPPKKLMRFLGYRSVDSLIKREKINELYSACKIFESTRWVNKNNMRLKKLGPSDFDDNSVSVIKLDVGRWGKLIDEHFQNEGRAVYIVSEASTVVLLASKNQGVRGLAICFMPVILEALNQIKASGSFIKLNRFKPDYGLVVSQSIVFSDQTLDIRSYKFHWSSIQKYLSSGKGDKVLDVLYPHLQIEDVSWRRAEESLYRLEPALVFWRDSDYVGKHFPEGTISFNLVDVGLNYMQMNDFGNHTSSYMKRALRDELLLRYISAKHIEQSILDQFDSSGI
jgi:hypothetical protein